MGSGCRGSTEREGSGTRSRTGRFVLAGSGSDAPEYAHSLHSTIEGARRAGSRLRIIARRSVIGRPGKIETMKSGAVMKRRPTPKHTCVEVTMVQTARIDIMNQINQLILYVSRTIPF